MSYRETITWRTDRYSPRQGRFCLALGPAAPFTDNLRVHALVRMANGETHEVDARIVRTEWQRSDILGNHASGQRSMLELPEVVWGDISEVELTLLT